MRASLSARRWTSPVGVALAAALLAASCSDDGEASEANTTTTPPPEYPESVEPVPSPGCGSSTAGELQRERRTLEVQGEERWFLLSVPPAHDGETPLPLVVGFHGLAQGAELIAEFTLIDDLGAEQGFVSVFPQGSAEPVRWELSLEGDNADFDFVEDMLDTLAADLCLDEARFYATGHSFGAMMSSALGCAMSDRLAAVAPVSGVERYDGCDPERPVPVLAYHGTLDPILFFNGGVGDLGEAMTGGGVKLPDGPVDLHGDGYPAAAAAWAEANGCGESSDEPLSPQVIERVYDCPTEAEVRFLIIEGDGHSWPGSQAYVAIESIVGPTTDELDATSETWDFFQRHANPAATSGS